ncbi:hypothetical protein Salat_0701900 [Sesamum alatum]|uniref:RNase H type-1 domain-containing protein n=1 Tax=Sesamum alatum TaxID=300844 RepID=A0AAE1YS08_9LAMI|nr:hypothetical protein Salat_0701900 [Sesamum alatum]
MLRNGSEEWSRNWKDLRRILLSPSVGRFGTTAIDGSRTMQGPFRRMLLRVQYPPPNGIIKINFDGATFAEENAAGIRVIARSSNGTCVGWRKRLLPFKAAPEHCEMLAAATAVFFGKEKGWNHVMIEGDCLLVITKLTNEDQDFSTLGNLVQDIKNNSKDFSFCRFIHVPREANILAHRLARDANSNSDGDDVPIT